jgi:hypothetical protein
VHSRIVLLLGGDEGVEERCRRAAAPFPIVRAAYLGTAIEFTLTMRPLAVIVAPDVPTLALNRLREETFRIGIDVIQDCGGDALPSDVDRALAGRLARIAASNQRGGDPPSGLLDDDEDPHG